MDKKYNATAYLDRAWRRYQWCRKKLRELFPEWNDVAIDAMATQMMQAGVPISQKRYIWRELRAQAMHKI